CPVSGVSGRNCAPSLVSVGGTVPHHWCQWEEQCPVSGFCGRNSAPSLVSGGGNSAPSLVSGGRNSAPSLVSMGGIVPRHWCQWEE
ncbi:unnamed protein product, partial [Staurois parvus]